MTPKHKNVNLKELGDSLLKIGTLLMTHGANSLRIRKTVDRIAGKFGCKIDLLITQRALVLNLSQGKGEMCFSSVKQAMPLSINFRIVSGISRMSWRVLEEDWSVGQINKEIKRLVTLPHYPRLVVLLVIGLAGASFCRLFEGAWLDMGVTFLATVAGLFVRQESAKRRFNPYMCTLFASFVSSIVAALFVRYAADVQEQALFASVLYLIPGVPLINSFSDLINGHIMNGIVRSVNGLIISFAIALGFTLATQICQLQL